MTSIAKFCRLCNSLLEKVFVRNEMLFVCESCQRTYKAEPEDTLCREQIKGVDIILDKALERAADDPAVIKAKVKCIKKNCNNDIVKQVRMNDTSAKLYNICIKCHFQWLAN